MVTGGPKGKDKQISISHPTFVKGGSGHMCGYHGSGTAQPESMVNSGPDSGKWAKGGPAEGKMLGRPGRTQKPGVTT